MTTAAAAALYESQYLMQYQGRPIAIFNPQKKPVDQLPVIYGFNNGGSQGFMHAQLISEDGQPLGSHLCSSEAYMPHDLGILEGSRPDRHDGFASYYPEGYRMEFVSHKDVDCHEKLNKAFDLHDQKFKQQSEAASPALPQSR